MRTILLSTLLLIYFTLLLHDTLAQSAVCYDGDPLTLPQAQCTGEAADICGFLPSTYSTLGVGPGVPPLCNADCSLVGKFDKCGVCGGLEPITQLLLEPNGLPDMTRIGGSVAVWNGSVAISQHINQELSALINAPVVTWTRDPTTGDYEFYQLPSSEGDAIDDETRVPLGKGHALIMSENFLVVGSHDSHPRVVQLWTRTCETPWTFTWSASDPCPGNLFGFTVSIDERVPKDSDDGIFGTVIAGDPGAFFSGRVFVYYTYSPGILQTLFYGSGNETERACFGHSVSADSGYLAVGAPALDYGGETNAGSVFLYEWNPASGIQGEYEFRTQITPPVPELNGGFGQSVSVWDCWLLIGDNQRKIYLYKLVGAIAVPLSIDNPTGLNLVSRLGYTVSIWDQYAVAGDENYITSPSARGASFVYDDNPLSPTLYRPMHRLNDDFGSFNTHYGSAVDVRGGCFIASGATGEAEVGGVYITDLCRSNCYGCDGVLNSCTMPDICGVCSGDNSTCVDCLGVFNGDAVEDECMVCSGTNTTCVIPYSVPSTIIESCEDGETIELRHLFEDQHGPSLFELIAPLPTKGSVLIENSGSLSPLPTLTYTGGPMQTGIDSVTLNVTLISTQQFTTLVIPVTIGSCIDCFGVPDGPARLDECGICNGDNSTCIGCDGVPNSGLVFDYCMDCGGNNSTCINITIPDEQEVDCTAQIIFELEHEPVSTPVTWTILEGPFLGNAFVNPQGGIVIYNNPIAMGEDWFIIEAISTLNSSIIDTANITFIIDDCMDCSGSQSGTQILDICGICGGDGSTCLDCLGVPFGSATLDICGVCNGDGSSCLDCAGVPFGPAQLDGCGVCNGDDTTCESQGGIPYGIILLFVFLFILAALIFSITMYWMRDTRASQLVDKYNLQEPTIKPTNQSVEVLRPSQRSTIDVTTNSSADQLIDNLAGDQDGDFEVFTGDEFVNATYMNYRPKRVHNHNN